jgi:hypothetical protein
MSNVYIQIVRYPAETLARNQQQNAPGLTATISNFHHLKKRIKKIESLRATKRCKRNKISSNANVSKNDKQEKR